VIPESVGQARLSSPSGGHRQEAQDDAAALGELLPGHEVAVMLEEENRT
jgi:hypothetical protein